MPTAHLCNSCGADLTWIRAIPDPHYALPIVVCPGCRRACTRNTRHPTRAGIYHAKRVAASLFGITIQFLVIGALLGFTLGVCAWITQRTITPGETLGVWSDLISGRISNEELSDAGISYAAMLALMVLLGAGAGAWTRSAMGHLRWWTTTFGWYALVIAACSAFALIGFAIRSSDSGARGWIVERGIWSTMMLLVAITVPAHLLAMPLGARAGRVWTDFRRYRARRYRRSQRTRRMNHARAPIS